MAQIDENGILIYDSIPEPVIFQANYIAKWKDGHIVDDVIAGYTIIFPCNWGTPACSHTEAGFVVDGELWFFSSTSRKELGTTGKTGTRWIRGEELLRNPERWIIQSKETAWYSVENMIDRANSLIGQEYDFVGVGFDFILPFNPFRKSNTIYCSKSVRFVWISEKRVVSPRRQYKWARKNGYKVYEGGAIALLKN